MTSMALRRTHALLTTLSTMLDAYEDALRKKTRPTNYLLITCLATYEDHPIFLMMAHPFTRDRIKRLMNDAEPLIQRLIDAISLTRDPITDDQINANAALVQEAIAFLDGKTT